MLSLRGRIVDDSKHPVIVLAPEIIGGYRSGVVWNLFNEVLRITLPV
jgi:hypothetical protein